MKPKVTFTRANPDFSAALRSRVEEYFKQKNVSLRGNFKLYSKTIILVGLTSALYAMLVFVDLPIWLSIIFCALLGAGLAGIGFNVMHDGAHGSYSQKDWVNEIMGHSLNLMGGSVYLWKQKHNIIHHTFTNLEGMDDDIDIRPWMRTNENQPKRWFHRYQHIYWVFLYGLTYITWVFQKDFDKYFRGKISGIKFQQMNLRDHIVFWISKLLYFSTFIVLPIFTVGWLPTLIGYLIVSLVCGWILAVVFQLAHVVDEASFPMPSENTHKVDQEWTIHQLQTTANFGTKSRILSWFAGGLNYQVEHHLFPKISHIHYPEISKVVKQVCSEYGVTYLEYPTMWSALRSHIHHLRMVGTAA